MSASVFVLLTLLMVMQHIDTFDIKTEYLLTFNLWTTEGLH